MVERFCSRNAKTWTHKEHEINKSICLVLEPVTQKHNIFCGTVTVKWWNSGKSLWTNDYQSGRIKEFCVNFVNFVNYSPNTLSFYKHKTYKHFEVEK